MQTFIVDTNAWINYFQEKAGLKNLIEDNVLKTPAIVMAELTLVMTRTGVEEEKKSKALEYVSKHSVILPLDENTAIKSGEIAAKEKLHLSDAIVYTYSSKDEQVLTSDSDFKGKPFTRYVQP